jgi:hypothetical protein
MPLLILIIKYKGTPNPKTTNIDADEVFNSDCNSFEKRRSNNPNETPMIIAFLYIKDTKMLKFFTLKSIENLAVTN